jgi:hypothetical protein
MKGDTLKANHGAQVHECLRHAVIVDSQAAHDINKIMIWWIELKQCFIIISVNTLEKNKTLQVKFIVGSMNNLQKCLCMLQLQLKMCPSYFWLKDYTSEVVGSTAQDSIYSQW